VPEVKYGPEPVGVWFYKVTCPVCQMVAPAVGAWSAARPGRLWGVGQDPAGKLTEFARRYGIDFPSVVDGPPYDISDAFGVRVVPTLFVVDGDGKVAASVESWDRGGYNHAARLLAGDGPAPPPVSEAGDGLPAFRPG
jgi:peroxiredoxin